MASETTAEEPGCSCNHPEQHCVGQQYDEKRLELRHRANGVGYGNDTQYGPRSPDAERDGARYR